MSQPITPTRLAQWSDIADPTTPDLQTAVRHALGEDAGRYNIQGLVEAYAETITEGLPDDLELHPDGYLYGPEDTDPLDAIAAVQEQLPGIDFLRILAPQYLLHAAPIPIDLGPATILTVDAASLPHRLAINPHGAEAHIDRLVFDAGSGRVLIEMTAYDDDGDLTDDTFTVMDLRGWTIQ